MSAYRIVKDTLADDSEVFKVEKLSGYSYNWLYIADRTTIEEARNLITFLKDREVVKSEVVQY